MPWETGTQSRARRSTLEPEIVRIAGATDHVIRKYVDEKSGQTARSWFSTDWPTSFGRTQTRCLLPGDWLQICLAVTGSGSSRFRSLSKSTTAPFRLQHYVKSKAGQTDYREVYYSFQNAGRWGVDMGENWKSFRYHPGMFKVQVSFRHRVATRSTRVRCRNFSNGSSRKLSDVQILEVDPVHRPAEKWVSSVACPNHAKGNSPTQSVKLMRCLGRPGWPKCVNSI